MAIRDCKSAAHGTLFSNLRHRSRTPRAQQRNFGIAARQIIEAEAESEDRTPVHLINAPSILPKSR